MRSFSRNALVFTTLTISSVACRTTSSQLSDVAPPTLPPVLVVSGGFSSCGSISASQGNNGAWRHWGNPGNMDMAGPLEEIRREYSDQFGKTAPQFVISCYNGKASNYIYFYSSANTRLRYTKWNSLQPLVDEIDQFGATREVFFVGHSYGGWLAMQLAKQSGVAFKAGLVTIDPISPYHCNQVSYAKNVLSASFGGGTGNGCNKFPPDTDSTFTGDLKKSVTSWHHFFQTDYKALHSNFVNNSGSGQDSSITSGGYGFRIGYSSGGYLGGVHTQIDTSETVWIRVRKLLGLSQSPAPAAMVAAGAERASDSSDFVALDKNPETDAELLPDDDATQLQEQLPYNGGTPRAGGQPAAAPAAPAEAPAAGAGSFGRL